MEVVLNFNITFYFWRPYFYNDLTTVNKPQLPTLLMYSSTNKRINPATGNHWLTNNRLVSSPPTDYPDFPTVELSDDVIMLDGEEEATPFVRDYFVIHDSDSEDDSEEEDLENFESDVRIAKAALLEKPYCACCLGEITELYQYFGFYYCSQRCVMDKIKYNI